MFFTANDWSIFKFQKQNALIIKLHTLVLTLVCVHISVKLLHVTTHLHDNFRIGSDTGIRTVNIWRNRSIHTSILQTVSSNMKITPLPQWGFAPPKLPHIGLVKCPPTPHRICTDNLDHCDICKINQIKPTN